MGGRLKSPHLFLPICSGGRGLREGVREGAQALWACLTWQQIKPVSYSQNCPNSRKASPHARPRLGRGPGFKDAPYPARIFPVGQAA